jgi:hypothetical protein
MLATKTLADCVSERCAESHQRSAERSRGKVLVHKTDIVRARSQKSPTLGKRLLSEIGLAGALGFE